LEKFPGGVPASAQPDIVEQLTFYSTMEHEIDRHLRHL